MSTEDRMMKAKEVAAFLGVSEATLQAWRTSGEGDLPFCRIGRKAVRYRMADVQDFVLRNTTTGTTDA